MHQRRLRLGDILDDYCPRERRITNHAVVAMIEDDVRQTRCTTCDAEHEYKQGKMPTLRRKKDSVAAAYKEVLAAVTTDATEGTEARVERAQSAEPQGEAARTVAARAEANGEGAGQPNVDQVDAAHDEMAIAAAPEDAAAAAEEASRVHRRLIRATLPRPENQQVQRPVPEFTMRQPQGRTGKFRGRGPGGGGARAAAGRGGFGNSSRPAGFGRGAGSGRTPGARNDFHRPPRGGQAPRRDKKR